MSDAKVTFAGDAASLLAEHKKIEDAKNKEIAGLKALLAESKKTYSEEQKHLREKQAALDKTRTAQQVYNDQMQKWFNLMATGKITLAEFNRLKGVESATLNTTTAALAKENKERNLAISTKQTDAIMSRNSTTAVAGMGGAFTAAAAVIGTATVALRAFAAEQERLQAQSGDVVASVDKLARKYAVQAGLKPDQIRGKRDEILEVAKENAVSTEFAFSAATQLSAMGLSDPQSLDSFIKVMSASNLTDEDPKQLVMALNQYMEGSNMKMTPENMMKVGTQMRGLYKNTQVEVSDLTQYAQAIPLMSQKMSNEEALGILTALRQSMPAALASTAGKNIVSKLGSVKGDKVKEDALQRMGLSWSDVDMIGESPKAALTTLKTAWTTMPKEDQQPALVDLFGLETQAGAVALFEKMDKLDQYTADMKDKAGFIQGVENAQSGDAARRQRNAIALTQVRLRNELLTSMRDHIANKEQLGYETGMANIESSRLSPVAQQMTKGILYAGRTAKNWLFPMTGARPEDLYTSPESRQRLAESYYRDTNQTFTEAELNQRLGEKPDPQAAAMAEQNAHLRTIAEAVTNPANKPVVNPNATGRTDK